MKTNLNVPIKKSECRILCRFSWTENDSFSNFGCKKNNDCITLNCDKAYQHPQVLPTFGEALLLGSAPQTSATLTFRMWSSWSRYLLEFNCWKRLFSAIHTNTGKGERLQMLTKHLELLYVVFSVECTPAGRRHIDYRVDTFKAYTHALHRPS